MWSCARVLQTRVIPCLLLSNKGLVKTVKFKDPKYVGDPINAIRIFNEKEVDELVFLDIDATKTNRKISMALIAQIASECFMPLAVGGGISSLEEAKEIMNTGVEKIVINSSAVSNPGLISSVAKVFGSQSVVASIDAKKKLFGNYEVMTHGGSKPTGLNPAEWAQQLESLGAGELFINSIDKDGTMQGYDLELISKVAELISIPVIACGGAGKLEDFGDAVKNSKVSAVAAGSMFVFYGPHRAVLINYPNRNELEKVLG